MGSEPNNPGRAKREEREAARRAQFKREHPNACCERDTDDDGKCPWHPAGIPEPFAPKPSDLKLPKITVVRRAPASKPKVGE